MTHSRIGVMGGSFDPIHHGHLVAASEVAHRFSLDRVLFSPTGQAWHKQSANAASPELRYLMTVVATAGDPRFDVTRVDIDRPGPTYTVDTLRDLQAGFGRAHPQDTADWFFITGADALAEVVAWRDPDGILERAHLIGVTRPGHVLRDPGLAAGSATLVEVPALAISSTDVRARVARGEPIGYLVPDGVAHLIAKHRLYAAP
ncbi:MAG: nicotinate-nucleotide adenylyltransferase [Actinomycetota bacterium]|nr:nicotinate-nucleotide adenylyltransferase [Actinomycetota bacterium]